jgi:hypothetical protein
MIYRTALFVAVLLASVSTASGCAPLSLRPTTHVDTPAQGVNSAPAELSGFFVIATVHKLDRSTGVVNLETERGTLYAIASPEDMLKLHEGDVLLVYVAGDEEPPTVRI